MTRLATLAVVTGLALGGVGLSVAPASAQSFGFGFSTGPTVVTSPVWDHPRHQRWGQGYGQGYGHGHGRGYGHGYGHGYGWRPHRPDFAWGQGRGHCQTVMVTRFSHRFGGYVQRPVEICR